MCNELKSVWSLLVPLVKRVRPWLTWEKKNIYCIGADVVVAVLTMIHGDYGLPYGLQNHNPHYAI